MKAFSQMTPEELSGFLRNHDEISREDSFVSKELVPWLKNEQDTLARTNSWRPGPNGVPADPMKIGVNTIWNSGIIEGLGILLTELERVKLLADEAKKELNKREKKAEREKNK